MKACEAMVGSRKVGGAEENAATKFPPGEMLGCTAGTPIATACLLGSWLAEEVLGCFPAAAWVLQLEFKVRMPA
jgi:hypothetical protein